MRIAVIGNTPVNGGVAVAADLALCGHDVAFAPWPGEEKQLDPLLDQGGIRLEGETALALSGAGGLASLRLTASLPEALDGAELVLLDMAAPDFEMRFAQLLPVLARDQHVHVNMHGYWPALRLAPLLRDAGREDVTISESTAPTHAAAYSDGVVSLQWVRRKVAVAVFPAERSGAAMQTLSRAFEDLHAAANVLETGFAGLNMMVHFPIVLVNIGWCERLERRGADVPIYLSGMTRSASLLVDGQDGERRLVAQSFGSNHKSLAAYLCDYYDASGADALTAVAMSRYYRELPPYPATAWRRWLSWDVPHGHVPMIEFADKAGIDAPLHKAAVSLASVFLERDFHGEGLTLERLGLAGLSIGQIRDYVDTGRMS
ncbi:NAD/NADP octopine/nopaline dehydrogenase family protein [Pantanalinema rosaneae CENA516]|uniref:NAD/NADP octopine/nopaline dehydrogenase family protein n=1 Tax=Pantanalinema rosaneae TaxID=1620701 RepID=UPI003D6EB535